MKNILKEAESMKHMAQKLQKYDCISKFDSASEPEAWRLAHSLNDLGQSFRKVLDIYLPALYEADGEQEVNDALLDLGEEFRHIIYHIRDPRFFSYLFEK